MTSTTYSHSSLEVLWNMSSLIKKYKSIPMVLSFISFLTTIALNRSALKGLSRKQIVNNADPKDTRSDRTVSIPAVIIAGTQKGGTEAVRTYLARHPQMIQSLRNEPHFFDSNCDKKCSKVNHLSERNIKHIREVYKNDFFNVTEFENNPKLLGFEKTPIYLFNPWVPRRVKKIIPWAKIIMLLRDPVERAYSTFKMNYIRYNIKYYEKEYGKVTFETCVEVDIAKLKEHGILYDETFWHVDNSERERRWLNYWNEWDVDFLTSEEVCSAEIGRGLYFLQIQRWFKAYNDDDSRRRIFVIKSESLLPNIKTHKINFTPITNFIGIDEMDITAEKKIHSYNLGPMNTDTKKKLQKLFDPFNRELYSILGKDWNNPWPYDI